MTTKGANANRKTAGIVGALILTATATYMLGDGLVGSILDAPDYLLDVYPNRSQIISGVLFTFIAAAANVGIGVLLFPILKKHSETVALGYVTTRIFDGAGIVVSGVSILSLIALSRETLQAGTQSASQFQTLGNLLVAGSDTAFLVTMIALGLGSLPFCYLLYRSRLIPRPMSVLGLIGYASLLTFGLLGVSGYGTEMLLLILGALSELIFPVWLIVKGFNPSAIVSEPSQADMDESDKRSLSKA